MYAAGTFWWQILLPPQRWSELEFLPTACVPCFCYGGSTVGHLTSQYLQDPTLYLPCLIMGTEPATILPATFQLPTENHGQQLWRKESVLPTCVLQVLDPNIGHPDGEIDISISCRTLKFLGEELLTTQPRVREEESGAWGCLAMEGCFGISEMYFSNIAGLGDICWWDVWRL